MLNLITRKRATLQSAPADLLGKLLWLHGFGRPWVHATQNGKWRASIDMNTSTAGASFEIKSEFLACPAQAVDQVIERVRTALEQQR